MANKRQILEVLSRKNLQQLVAKHELEVADRRSRDGLLEGLMAARRIKIEDALTILSLAELQDVGKNLGLAAGPRQKSKLIAQLLSGKPAATASGRGTTVAKKSTSKKKATKKKNSKKKATKKAAKTGTSNTGARKKKATKKKASRKKKTTRRASAVASSAPQSGVDTAAENAAD